MSVSQTKSFNLPWHQYDQYWISVSAKGGGLPVALMQTLKSAGMQLSGNTMQLEADRRWKKPWDAIYEQLLKGKMAGDVQVAVTPGHAPDDKTIDWKSAVSIQNIADSLWLGDALIEDRILCYLQPVVSSRDKVFGYESFARVEAEDGNVIGGDKIIMASRALNIEYMIDRHLHVQAITTFVCSDFDGFLFVNLFPSFIHRPEGYLGGLSDAAKSFGIISKHVVLDFTGSESPRDVMHLRNICEYGKSRGYSVALDDIASLEGAKKLVPDIRPDFVKLDMKLTSEVEDAGKRETISRIVELVHGVGGTVIAEGVETELMYQTLKSLGVDLFQGYYFSPPVPVETVVNRSTGTS